MEDRMQFCSHCGATQDDEFRFCESCGSSLIVDDATARLQTCASCRADLAAWWRFCVRCGSETRVAYTRRSRRVEIHETPVQKASERPQLDRPTTEHRRSEHLLPGTFGEMAGRHTSHREHSPALKAELVDDIDTGAELISRDRATTSTVTEPEPNIILDDDAVIELEAPTPPPSDDLQAASRPHSPEPPEPQQWPRREIGRPEPTGAAHPVESTLAADPPPEVVPLDDRPLSEEPSSRDVSQPTDDLPAMQHRPPSGKTVPKDRPRVDIDGYRDPYITSRAAELLLLVTGALASAATIGLIVLNNRIDSAGRGVPGALARAADIASQMTTWIIRPLEVVVVLTLLSIAVWTFVAYANLRALGRTDLRLHASAAIWSWFVPGMNLVVPKRLIDDCWRGASEAAFRDRDWRLRRGLIWTNVFWWGSMAGLALTFVGWRLSPSTIEAALDANGWAIIANGAVVVASLAGVRMVAATSARQNETAEAHLD